MDENIVYYPLTHPQKGIWYTEKLYSGTSIATISATLKLYGDIDYQILDKAINHAVQKNDAFRTKIIEIDNVPYQYLTDHQYQPIEFVDFNELGVEKMFEWDTGIAQSPLDLANLEFYKIYILKIDQNSCGFFLKIHHTLADAWSIILFANEVMKSYDALKSSQSMDDKKYPSYLEYLKSEQQYLSSERFERDRAYWKEKFSTLPETMSLKPRKTNTIETKAKRKTFVLPTKLNKKIRQYCSDTNTSMLTLFMCALSMYLNRVTGKNDIVIGTPVLNRSNIKEKETIGMFINTIPIRTFVNENMNFSEFTQNVTKELLLSLKHQKYSIDFIMEDIKEMYKNIEKPFDICLSYQNARFAKNETVGAQEGRWHFAGRQMESLYIHINEREGNGDIVIDYDFLSELFCTKEIDFLHDHLIRLLWHSIDNPGRKLTTIEMVSEKEKQKILHDFNDTKCEFPQKTIVEIFEEQVQKTPSNIALIYKDQSMTYHELNSRVNKLAHLLRKKGVRPNDIIGISIYRSFEMIIGILAILKAGGAYLPVDPNFPADRISYMLENSNIPILLTSRSIEDKVRFPGRYVYFDDYELNGGSEANLEKIDSLADLAYVIYTSGSTGRPKGAMIEHHSVVNRIHWMQKKYDLHPNERLILKTPYTFDVSVWELMWWFFTGASLVILEPGKEKEPNVIMDEIEKNGVTMIHFVPSMLNEFLDYIKTEDIIRMNTLRRVFASGEALTRNHADKFSQKFQTMDGISLHNLYGPTEATVDVSYFDISKEHKMKTIPIGKPIDNIQLYILDKYHNILPVGAVGELYIAGEGLARGYINNPETTKEKFIENPFEPGSKMYKTGDLARWFPKGDIEFLGRIDHQVKIRGYRIELNEIQEELLRIPSVKNAVVVCREDSKGTKHICAYLVYNYNESISNIKKHLVARIPSYMIPAYFVELAQIPISLNGKINHSVLPDPFKNAIKDTGFVPPRNENEQTLADIWAKVLNMDPIGIKDNFFDIGGDSLCAMRVSLMLNGKISIEDIYKNPTIELLSEQMMNSVPEYMTLANLSNLPGKYDLSVICVPYGGGGPIAFRGLEAALEHCNVFAVKHQNASCSIEEMAGEIVKEILDKIPGEIIIYGHCVGCALSLEMARQLDSYGRKIVAVYMGGSMPPKVTSILGRLIDPWYLYSDKSLVKFLNFIGQETLNTNDDTYIEIIKAFRHDVRAFYRYFDKMNKEEIQKIHAPIIAIVGENDIITNNSASRYKLWFRYSNSVQLKVIKSAKHYFIEANAHEVAEIISTNINRKNIYLDDSVSMGALTANDI